MEMTVKKGLRTPQSVDPGHRIDVAGRGEPDGWFAVDVPAISATASRSSAATVAGELLPLRYRPARTSVLEGASHPTKPLRDKEIPMRRLVQILGAAGLVVLASACNDTTKNVDGLAGPVGGGSSAPSSTPAVTVSDAPRSTPTSPAPSTSPPPPSVRTADLVINPDHIGKLKIGMSLSAAKATGLVVVNAGQAGAAADACVSAHWKGRSDEDWMIFNGRYGLRALNSYGNQKTPEGIHPGSTLAALRKAYPQLTWRLDGDEIPENKRTDGDAMVDAVKGDGAHYRINVQKSKVASVQLESDRTGCYE
jgi:hypothetical protein